MFGHSWTPSRAMLQPLCAGKIPPAADCEWVLTPTSYNKINGSWACENDGIMNKLLKDEMGFRGYIMSDWNGGKSLSLHSCLLLT